jgi:hypothetical protein
LIIGNATFTEVEEIWNLRTCALHTFRTNKRAQDATCRASVLQWLPSFDYEAEQSHHRKTRSFCKSSGAWLLKDHRFQQWLNPEDCSTPLLWLNGIPGAGKRLFTQTNIYQVLTPFQGKTILASTIIDDARISQDATVVYFYCKYGDQARNSFISAARSILAQLLKQHPELLPYFHERSSMSGDVELKSVPVAKEMLQAALNSCQKTYVVIDGVDECGRDDRQEIAESFRTIVDSLPTTTIGSVRCLFISQDDGIARRDFKDLPTITIIDENQQDIKEFASVWHQRLEEKFGPLRSNNCYISKIITARAQGNNS